MDSLNALSVSASLFDSGLESETIRLSNATAVDLPKRRKTLNSFQSNTPSRAPRSFRPADLIQSQSMSITFHPFRQALMAREMR